MQEAEKQKDPVLYALLYIFDSTYTTYSLAHCVQKKDLFLIHCLMAILLRR